LGGSVGELDFAREALLGVSENVSSPLLHKLWWWGDGMLLRHGVISGNDYWDSSSSAMARIFGR
jgi:hypothetical protein